MKRKNWRDRWVLCVAVAGSLIFVELLCQAAFAQADSQASTPQQPLPQIVQQAQTVSIPLHAFSLANTSPIRDLQPSDLRLTVDGNPQSFQLSHLGPNAGTDQTANQTQDELQTQTEERPNLLIILPAALPIDRNDAINEAIAAFKKAPPSGWNIAILDDSGNQTAYTHQTSMVIAELEKIGAERPTPTDLESWRSTATDAIAAMRDLPGRRIVLSLGDIFHEMVFQDGGLAYNNFEVGDVATAAINAGVVIYASESASDIDPLRKIAPAYTVAGTGPWMLLARGGRLAGWISGSVFDTMQQIRRDGAATYSINLYLQPKQMDGLPHMISVTTQRQQTLVDAPPYYMAPSLAQLTDLAKISAAVRQALRHPPTNPSAPLQIATQLEYFPHPDGKLGTQISSTKLFWSPSTPPPAQLELAQQMEQVSTGFMVGTIVGRLEWSFTGLPWNTAMVVGSGAYTLRVAAADLTGKITAGTAVNFTVAPPDPGEKVRISSLVIGNGCVFSPLTAKSGAQPQAVDYLRAGECILQLDPGHSYTPQDIVWTLVRITPVGKLADRPSKDWKGSFLIVDAKGSRLAEEPIRWLNAKDGSFVATTAFPLDNPKLKLVDGEYAILFRLRGPGIEPNYSEDAPFLIYGAEDAASESHRRH